MSLSKASIQRYLAKNFVLTWGNVEGDPNAGASFAQGPKDAPADCIRGNGEHNVQILTLTPEGELLNATAGYLSPDELREELDLALELWHALQKIEGQGPKAAAARRRLVRERHEAFVTAFEDRDETEGIFASFIRGRVVSDHRFVAKHPLMDAHDFRPEAMVGNAKTFFGGYKGGTKPGRIGEGPEFPGPGRKRQD